MTEPEASDWNDLSRMWQADAAGVSPQDIEAHLERERRQMLGVTLAEMFAVAAGAVAAAVLLLYTPHVWLGVLTIVFGGISAGITLRMRREGLSPGSADLLKSLKDSIDREDWITGQLQLGRAMSLVALFAIVIATAMQLLRLQAFSATGLIAAGIGGTVVLAALAWNLILTVRSRRRLARLKYLDERLKA